MKFQSTFTFHPAFPLLYGCLGVVLLLSGCGKEYIEDIKPLTFKNQETPDFEAINSMVVGSYFALSQETGNGGLHHADRFAHEMMSDNVQFLQDAPFISQSDQDLYQRNREANFHSRIEAIWKGGYKAAINATTALDEYQKVAPKIEADSADINRMRGEAFFVRAYAHFALVRFFAPPYPDHQDDRGIILVDKKPKDAFDNQAPATVGRVYDQIIADCKKAINLLPESYQSGLHPSAYATKGRAKRDAARFLLAKVYFQMGEDHWDKALPLMNEVLDDNQYSLAQEPKTNWTMRGPETNNPECVWMYVNTSWKTGKPYQVFLASDAPLSGAPDAAHTRAAPLSEDFMQAANWQDSASAQKDARYRQLVVEVTPEEDATTNTDFFRNTNQAYTWLNMYQGYAGRGYQVNPDGTRSDVTPDSANVNTNMMRSGELRLLRATIYAATGQSDPAPDVNAIRQRAGLSPNPPYSLEDVIREHRIETLGDGRRINYLKALERDIPAGDRNTEALPYDSRKLYWSYPSTELEQNPALN